MCQLHVPSQLRRDCLLQALCRIRLSMDQECCLRCARESPKPGEKLIRISVVAELFQGSNVGADGNFLGIDPHGFGAALDDGPARARRLKTDENHLMARIGQAVKQMVQDASTSD